jgi:hypothetical protein
MFPLRAHDKHNEIDFGNSLHVAIAVQAKEHLLKLKQFFSSCIVEAHFQAKA